MNYHAHKLLTTVLSLTNYCQEVFRPRLKFPGWAMPTLIFSRVGTCPPCSPCAGAHVQNFKMSASGYLRCAPKYTISRLNNQNSRTLPPSAPSAPRFSRLRRSSPHSKILATPLTKFHEKLETKASSRAGQCVPAGYCHAHIFLYVSGVNDNVNSKYTKYFAQLCGRISTFRNISTTN